MAGSVNLLLQRKPVTAVARSGSWIDIKDVGVDFGPEPDVRLFMPIIWEEGKLLKTTTPLVGTLSSITPNARAVKDAGELWVPYRDPAAVDSTTENEVKFDFETEKFAQFFWSCRMKGQTGKIFPSASAPDTTPTGNTWLTKLYWFGTPDNSAPPDQVLPNLNGSGINAFGNTVSVYPGPGNTVVRPWPGQNGFDVTKPNSFSFYQSGEESTPGAYDASVIMESFNSSGRNSSEFNANPFGARNPLRITVSVQNNATYQLTLDGVDIPNPYVSDSSATAAEILAGIVAATNANQTKIFASLSIESPLTTITFIPILMNYTPTMTGSANISVNNGMTMQRPIGYYRFGWNAQRNTPAGGWSKVQILTNCPYLAAGDHALSTIFIGDAPTLAACKDAIPIAADYWSTNRVVLPDIGVRGYVHYRRHHDRMVFNNIMGGIV